MLVSIFLAQFLFSPQRNASSDSNIVRNTPCDFLWSALCLVFLFNGYEVQSAVNAIPITSMNPLETPAQSQVLASVTLV